MDQVAPGRGAGMILGKFMPPHAGHQFLVEFGRQFVDRLYVLVCSLPTEPIPGHLRFQWMRELYPGVQVRHIQEELPQEPHEHPEFWTLWRQAVQQAVGEPLDFVFASESYGHRLARELDARFVPADLPRSVIPVSGTQVRDDPLGCWSFLPECVRPYFVRRVCLFGPESTGKSTLAQELASHFQTVHVPEFARAWLDPKQGTCHAEDIPVIARGQAAMEDALARRAHRVLFCDTDLLLTTVWSDELFGDCPAWIRDEARRRSYDLYLLLDVDVPWVDDAQRYLPHRRREFLDRCRQVLEAHQRSYVLIQGSWEERRRSAIRAVEQVLRR